MTGLSKRPAEVRRSGERVPPGPLHGAREPDPWAGDDLRRPVTREQLERRLVKGEAVVLAGEAECLAQLPRARAERPLCVDSAAGAHPLQPVRRPQCADQRSARGRDCCRGPG